MFASTRVARLEDAISLLWFLWPSVHYFLLCMYNRHSLQLLQILNLVTSLKYKLWNVKFVLMKDFGSPYMETNFFSFQFHLSRRVPTAESMIRGQKSIWNFFDHFIFIFITVTTKNQHSSLQRNPEVQNFTGTPTQRLIIINYMNSTPTPPDPVPRNVNKHEPVPVSAI